MLRGREVEAERAGGEDAAGAPRRPQPERRSRPFRPRFVAVAQRFSLEIAVFEAQKPAKPVKTTTRFEAPRADFEAFSAGEGPCYLARTPLHVKMLIDARANIHANDGTYGLTPLSGATRPNAYGI